MSASQQELQALGLYEATMWKRAVCDMIKKYELCKPVGVLKSYKEYASNETNPEIDEVEDETKKY